jgi:transposase
MKQKFSQEQLNHMKELRESGSSQRAVAAMYNCHQKTLYYWESRAFVLTNNSIMFQTQGRYRSNSRYFVKQEELDKMKTKDPVELPEHQPGTYQRRGLVDSYRYAPDPLAPQKGYC